MKSYLLCVGYFLLMLPGYGQGTTDAADKGCKIEGNRIICPNGQVTNIGDMLGDRVPHYTSFSLSSQVPANCHKTGEQKMQALIDRFKSEDSASLRQLANSFCSHLAGWVEFVPGTCQAGGPPPLCPADHWHYVGPLEGMRQWKAEQQQLRQSREKELNSGRLEANQAICDCWLGELQKHEGSLFKSSPVPHPADRSQTVNITTFNHMPCLGGCPPGYTCDNGFCVPREKVSEVSASPNMIKKKIGADNYYTLQGAPAELAKDKAIDYGKDRLLNTFELGKKYLHFMKQFQGPYVQAAFFALEQGYPVTAVNDNYTTYMKRLDELNDDINNLETLYDQLERYKQGRNLTRDLPSIRADIAKVKETINRDLLILNEDRATIIVEKGFSGMCCSQVLNYYNDKVFEFANHVLNIPDE